MKNIISAVCLSIAALGLTACNGKSEKAKLADSMNGSWNSAPERITTSDNQATTTVERTLTFASDKTSNTGGNVDGSVKFSVLSGTQLQTAEVQPISVTATGTASVSGRWEAIDDDEILVTWDFTTLKVNVDPDAVDLDYDIATETDSETLQALKPAVVKSISSDISAALPTEVFNFGKIDDIDFINQNTSMKCEIGHKDYIFQKVL